MFVDLVRRKIAIGRLTGSGELRRVLGRRGLEERAGARRSQGGARGAMLMRREFEQRASKRTAREIIDKKKGRVHMEKVTRDRRGGEGAGRSTGRVDHHEMGPRVLERDMRGRHQGSRFAEGRRGALRRAAVLVMRSWAELKQRDRDEGAAQKRVGGDAVGTAGSRGAAAHKMRDGRGLLRSSSLCKRHRGDDGRLTVALARNLAVAC